MVKDLIKAAYNTIEGLPHGGVSQGMRKMLTDFGSGWNALRGLLRASETFGEMTASKGFQRALKSAERGKYLGGGFYGSAYEMRGTFRGQQFSFARKTGEIGKQEVKALRAAEGTVGPSVYSTGKDTIDMELFTGATLGDIDPTQLTGLTGSVKKAFSSIHKAGFEHGDPHLQNIMLTGEGKIGVIDFGKARKLSDPKLSKDISSATEFIRSKTIASSSAAPTVVSEIVDPFATQFDSKFSGFDDAYNKLEGFRHGGLAEDMRTDFGSGWLGLGDVYRHELIGMSYIGRTEEELYNLFTTKEDSRLQLGGMFAEEEQETAATVGTAFHEYMETLKVAGGRDVDEIEKYISSAKHGLAGYADVVYEDGTISDIKSVSSDVLNKVKRRGGPTQKHFDQVNTYAILNGSRKGRMEYFLRDNPQEKVVYEWEASQEAFSNVMAKINRVRSRIDYELATGQLRTEDLPTKSGILKTRIKDIFVGNKYSFDVEGVKESLDNFINKRERYHNDGKKSTLEQLESFNINDRMDGNMSEYVFKGFKNAGRRHANMGYS